MLSEEDKNEIQQMIDNAIERKVPEIITEKITEFALKLPSILSNLVMEASAKHNLYKAFITDKDNQELFKNKMDIINKIIMEVESNNPGKPYQEVIELSHKAIKERLGIMGKLNFNKPEKPMDLQYKGELGEL